MHWLKTGLSYNLQATNALDFSSDAFAPVGPPPVVVDGKFTVTNATSGTARFYRLKK